MLGKLQLQEEEEEKEEGKGEGSWWGLWTMGMAWLLGC
jgi:hypothetical protein